MATIVLAHGAWSAAWAWKKMRPLMRAAGHEFFSPTYTGLGERDHLARPEIDLSTHIQDVLSVLEFEDLKDVTLLELVRCRLENMLAHYIRKHMDVCHCVLKLVPKPVGAAGLIERSPAPEAARKRLVQEPAVQQKIHACVGSLHLSLSQNFIPKFIEALSGSFHILNVLKVLDQALCICAVRPLTHQKCDLFRLTRLQPEQEL